VPDAWNRAKEIVDALMMLRLRRVGVAATWAAAKRTFADLTAELVEVKRERDDLRRQYDWLLAELRDLSGELRELRLAVTARQRAEDELAALHRERELMRALSAERDPALPLQ
jgi:hypothetical protein